MRRLPAGHPLHLPGGVPALQGHRGQGGEEVGAVGTGHGLGPQTVHLSARGRILMEQLLITNFRIINITSQLLVCVYHNYLS